MIYYLNKCQNNANEFLNDQVSNSSTVQNSIIHIYLHTYIQSYSLPVYFIVPERVHCEYT